MGTPRLRIERDDVAIEGFVVPIDARLPPSQQPQRDEGHRRNAQRPLLPPAWQATNPSGGRANDDRHDPDAGEVLKAVGDESVLHVAVIDEAEHRRQGDRKEQRPGQRSAPERPPEAPEGHGQRDGGDEIPPSERIGDADVPKWVDDGQASRPQELTRVKPQGAGRDERPFG